MTSLRWGSATDTGLVRRNNQDNMLTEERLFAVADGMGGHAAGEVASMTAVGALRDAFGELDHDERTADDLVTAMEHANEVVFEQSQADIQLRGMGTTMTAAALVTSEDEERLAIANVGDSRAYVFTHNELTQLTEDHSVAEELVRQGQLDPAEVDTHPQRHILTRAMGIMPEVEVDLWEVLPLEGDRVLLCSDGLVREVTDDQIASVLRRLADPTEAAQELVARARAGGGSDNITVVIIDVVDDGGLALTASAALAATQAEDDAALLRRDDVFEKAEDGAPAAAPPATPAAVTFSGTPPPKRKRVTFRVIAFIILVGGLIGGAGIAVFTYARDSYYVTLGPPAANASVGSIVSPGDRPIQIYQGRPGGLLWFDPTLALATQFNSAEVCPNRVAELSKGKVTSSLAAAETYVQNLIDEAVRSCEVTGTEATTTTTTASTTTTHP